MIVKQGRNYKVSESNNSWAVELKIEKLKLEWNISKEICPDYESLVDFILCSKMF